MIWFACRQCGQRQSRPEQEAGTLIFCSCGASNRVPWESSVPEPPPSLEPQAVDTLESGREPAPIPFTDDSRPAKPIRRTTIRERNPAFCFNHQDTVRQQVCVDCREGFCDECVVVFQK